MTLSYTIREIEEPPRLVMAAEHDGFILKGDMLQERRVRHFIYEMLKMARDLLPKPYILCLYETYRTHANQVKSWHQISAEMQTQHPHIDPQSDAFTAIVEEFIANPFKHGSGHQTGAAVDLTLCGADGVELDMGTPLNACVPLSRTDAPGLTPQQRRNRNILRDTMHAAGFVNYPSEWWHYSFGDRLWAEITGARVTVFAKLEL